MPEEEKKGKGSNREMVWSPSSLACLLNKPRLFFPLKNFTWLPSAHKVAPKNDKLFLKGQITNILGFAGHAVSLPTTQHCCCVINKATDNV